uniref:N-acylethanolamine-hydrolyzing acid amidase n=2 Tax=Brugia malayi TaxID=6279 RepID=A0A8L7TFG3_BRUMA
MLIISTVASVFIAFWSFIICTVNLADGDRLPQRYVINLDLAPENRWDRIIDDHKKFIPTIIEEINHYVPKLLRPIVWWIDENILLKNFPNEYTQEIRGIAKRSGLSIGEIVGINILYDISAFNRKHILANIGCTSIVAQDYRGRIIHGRNLDYLMTSLLRNLTIIVDFTRGGNVLYTAVTFALSVGIYTGQRHGSFSISVNERYSGAYIDTILMEFYTHFTKLVTFTVRMALEKKSTFEEAREMLMKEHFIAPSYLIIAGTEVGQACIITRDRWKAADLKCIDSQSDHWFLVETNFDHWKVDKDKRRRIAEKALRQIGKHFLSYGEMLQILSLYPIKNNNTVFSTVMSPLDENVLYGYTIVWE